MATSLHRVLQNFRWRCENITLQETSTASKSLEYFDPHREIHSQLGAIRLFTVNWLGSEPDPELHGDTGARITIHTIEVEEYLPLGATGYEWLEAQSIMVQDLHDIVRVLRNTDNHVGYDADNTSDNIGLWKRHPMDASHEVLTLEGTVNTKVLILRQPFMCKIKETEVA